MASSRTVTVYRNTNGSVEKCDVYRKRDGILEVVNEDALRPYGGNDAQDYHERIIRTYHELECRGELNDMSPRQKQRVRDLHEYAKQPGYWGAGYEHEYRS
jgi:hypothetical protein